MLSLLLITACQTQGPTYRIKVNSIAEADAAQQKKYVLMPANKDTSADDLQYREYAKYVHRALRHNGFVEITKNETPEIIITLGYGIGDRQVENRSLTLNRTVQTRTQGSITGYGGYATYSGTTSKRVPTTYSVRHETYFRYVMLMGFEYKKNMGNKKPHELWRTYITSRGSSDDLRQVFPVLIGASVSHIGGNTGKKITVNLHEGDKRVNMVKGIQVQKK